MKFLTSAIMPLMGPQSRKMNLRLLFKFLALLALLIVFFAIGFHLLMLYEGRYYSWFTGFYWALTTMSTLGFGDIVFQTDIGKAFSVIVLLTGMMFLLVLLPFTFIEFFYSPWMSAQQEARAPRSLPEDMSGHILLANYDPVSVAFIERLKKYGYPYALVTPNTEEALSYRDQGLSVVRADLEDPDSNSSLRLEQAAMLVATGTDVANTSLTFTARSISQELTIAATASSKESLDVLQLAGCDHVIQLGKLLGASLARRTIGGDAQAHIIGGIDQIKIAEATAAGTPLLGKTIRESKLRERTGLTIIGMWERGEFSVPGPDNVISSSTVLVLAGTEEQVSTYNALLCIYHQTQAHVVIIGAGRVGRATGQALEELEIDFRIVEKDPDRIRGEKYIQGSAADLQTLEKAGIREAPAVLITTREDDVNIYLTIYCRKLRPDIQIISRATLESNTSRLHRAGADFVMSYASMGANILFNLLRKEDILMVAEGLNVFRMPLPSRLEGKALQESEVREKTGCSVIALQRRGKMIMSPSPDLPLENGDDLVLIGTVEAEDRFLGTFVR